MGTLKIVKNAGHMEIDEQPKNGIDSNLDLTEKRI